MKSSIDYNSTVSQLGMGDRFKLEQHGAVVTVAWTDHSVDGSVLYVRDSDGERHALAMYRRCFVTAYAPRCGCGRRFEMCEQECEWPTELDALFAV